MLRSIKSNQRLAKMLVCKIDGATPALLEGGLSGEIALTKNGAGDYTLTFNPDFARVPYVVATVVGAADYCYSDNLAAGSVDILTQSAGDQTIDVMIMGFESSDEA